MISKAQTKALTGGAMALSAPKPSLLERKMLAFAMPDPGDKVLDAYCADGLLMECLYKSSICEICGVSDVMDDVKNARARLLSADILYAPPCDIPWHAESFSIVLLNQKRRQQPLGPVLLGEILRVLKPGGQLVLGAPSALCGIASGIAQMQPRDDGHGGISELLSSCGFIEVVKRRAGVMGDIYIGWKPPSAGA